MGNYSTRSLVRNIAKVYQIRIIPVGVTARFQKYPDQLPDRLPLCDTCHIVFLHVYGISQTSHLHDDEVHLCVVDDPDHIPGLIFRYIDHGKTQELCIPSRDFPRLVRMDYIRDSVLRVDADFGLLLRVCIIAVEESIQKLSWDVDDLANGNHLENRIGHGAEDVIENGEEATPSPHESPHLDNRSSPTQTARPTSICRVMNAGEAAARYGPPKEIRVETPQQIMDIRRDVVDSGVVKLPGVRDRKGCPVTVMTTNSLIWHKQDFQSSELTKLLLYYQSLHRDETNKKGMTVVVDARQGATIPVLNLLLDTLYAVETSKIGAISLVHVIADKHTQSLLFKSPSYKPHCGPKFDMLSTLDKLHKYIDKSQLPRELGGSFPYTHTTWVQFRQQLEAFSLNCQVGARFLVGVMQEMTDYSLLPATVEEANQLLEKHEECIKKAFDDPRLTGIQKEADVFMRSLKNYEPVLGYSDDFRESVSSAKQFYKDVQDTVYKLVKLADTRVHKLEQCHQLRQFEIDSSLIVNWLNSTADETLRKHHKPAETLKGIRLQQKDFDKFYFSAMTYIDKGSDLLEEASMLTQSGTFGEATGIKDVAKTLKKHIQMFTSKLEETRERIEDTSKCYNLLDRCYEWALEAMKHVTSIKVDNTPTAQQVGRLLASAILYARNNPPITAAKFDEMLRLSKKVSNKMCDQCKLARSRCEDTEKLMELRLSTLQKAKEQLEKDERNKKRDSFGRKAKKERRKRDSSENGRDRSKSPSPGFRSKSPSPGFRSKSPSPGFRSKSPSVPVAPLAELDLDDLNINENQSDDEYLTQHLNATSTPVSFPTQMRRRSYAGAPSAPMYSVSAPSNNFSYLNSRPSRLGNVDENLFREEMITSDYSDRVTTSIPKGLANNKLRSSHGSIDGSQDSLHSSKSSLSGSQDSVCGSQESLNNSKKSGDSKKSLRKSLRKCFQNSLQNLTQNLTRSLPGSREDLTNSKENLHDIQASINDIRASRDCLRQSSDQLSVSLEDLSKQKKSSSLPRDTQPPDGLQHKNRFKRSNTATGINEKAQDENVPPVMARVQRSNGERKGRWSLVSGSTESLPSMPEEEDSTDSGKQWKPVPVNTHLLKQSKTLMHHSSMADLNVTEAEIKSRRILAHVTEEMIQTERDYVNSLLYIIENYLPEIQREDVPQALRGKRNIIFGNIERIYEFHSQYFLQEVEQCENSPFQLCHSFLNHESKFYLYALYNKNKPKSDTLMAECGAAFFREKQRQLGDKMDLSSYLLKPVQRMGKYALLLKQIIKECPETEPDFQDLKNAEEMVKFQLRHGNDLLAMDSLKDCDVNLQEQGRLLRQERFLVWQGRRKSLRHVFLFDDLIVFSKTKHTPSGHDTYLYKHSIKTSDLGLTEEIGDSGYKFEIWFRKRVSGETYILQAPTMDVKNAWTKEISKILWSQACRNREARMVEMTSMGIGNKPCLDLKPNEDSISDRSINVSNISNKGRARNSISGVMVDNTKGGQKRPHSIISVSSSSSSNSSGHSSMQSAGAGGHPGGASNHPIYSQLGMYNLGFDSTQRPPTQRSHTLSSNESGIDPDMSIDEDILDQYRRGSIVSQGEGNFSVQSMSMSSPESPCMVLQSMPASMSTDV
ncbi:puratrophin-1-like isoform X2 [Lineus longissimus]|uniref:puratrophin-1-like isoform X2 n=1 Tax=Lineus longissimus TaxID=88925 RepID=UPI002B4F5E41